MNLRVRMVQEPSPAVLEGMSDPPSSQYPLMYHWQKPLFLQV